MQLQGLILIFNVLQFTPRPRKYRSVPKLVMLMTVVPTAAMFATGPLLLTLSR